ncbi:MAG: Serine/threonine-protein kinase PknB, partial [Planctomycetota bacterium]
MHATRSGDAPSSISAPPELPAQLGGIRVGRLLGAGGMGRVYLGHHPVLDVPVAVKVLLERGGDPSRFLTEARLAAKLQHPRVVRVLNAGEDSGLRWIAMEYVHGATLKEIVRDRGALPWREALGFALQAAEGLAAAHRAGIVHRDVKPSNLMVDAGGGVKVADLGLARSLAGSSDATVDGALIGTPAYMSPEQLADPRRATPAADVYALGATLVYLLTGQASPEAGPVGGLARAAGLPPAVHDLVRRMLAADPVRRPADGAAVVREIEAILGHVSTISGGSRITRRLAAVRAPRWLGAAAAASVLVLAGWAVAPGGGSGDPVPAPAP